MPTPPDDSVAEIAERIAKARDGSIPDLGELMEACQRYLLLVANKELRAELRPKGGASDIVQETFLEAQRDFARFEGSTEAELLAWLRRLLLNNLSNFARRYRDTGKRQLTREISLEAETEDAPRGRRAEVAGGSPSPSQVMMESEQNAEIEAAIARLPEHYQMVIHLRNKQDLSFQEIANKLESTPEAVRKLWSRGILQLQKEMESRSDSTHRSNP